MAAPGTGPLSYYEVFETLNQYVDKDCMIVSEGANTMDIGRAMIPNHLPRHRFGQFGIFSEYTL